MKTHFYATQVLCLLWALCHSFADASGQVVPGKDIIPKPGTRSVFNSLDSSCYRPGNSGPNQIWDFSGMQLLDSTALYYLKPEQTPYTPYFPLANMAMTADNISFDYFLFTDSGYYELGSVSYDTESGRAVKSAFSEPELMLKLPLYPGSRYHVSGSRKSEYMAWYHVYSQIETEHFVDAAGTVYLPCDTVYHAIRKLEKVIFNDSVSNGTRYVLARQTLEKYQWFAPGISAPVLSIEQKISTLNGETDTLFSGSVSCREKQAMAAERPYQASIGSHPDGVQLLQIDSKQSGKLGIKYTLYDNKQKKAHKIGKVRIKLNAGQSEFKIPDFRSKMANRNYVLKIELSGPLEAVLYLIEFNH